MLKPHKNLLSKPSFPQALSGSDSATLEFSARKKLKVDSNQQAGISKGSDCCQNLSKIYFW